MIVRHAKRSLTLSQNTLRPSRLLYDNQRVVFGHRHPRKFHASRPNLIVNEALQLSSTAFYFVHDTSGLAWGLSIPLTAALCQLAFTPLHYFIDQNRKLRAQGANLLIAWQTTYREQALAKKDERATEAEAAKAQLEVREKLKVKSKQLKHEIGYVGNWLALTVLSYVPVWISNTAALSRMCGHMEWNGINTSDASGIVLNPELTTDGMLWFGDLTIADPTWLLPLTAGGLFIASIAQISTRRVGPPTFLQGLIRALAVLSGPIFVVTGVSNAIALALIGSTAVTIVRRSVLDKVIGAATEIQPTKPRTTVLKKQYRVASRGLR